MNWRVKETLKSYAVSILIISSIIQVGILWTYQNHGFPTNFLSSLFHMDGASLMSEGVELFKPYRIIASDGEDSFFIVSKKTDLYTTLWNEAKAQYLKELLQNAKPIITTSYLEQEWCDLIVKKGIILDFKVNMHTDLLASFLQISTQNIKEITGIKKILLLPWEDINGNMTIYITDDIKLQKYVIPTKGIKLEEFNNIIEKISKDTTQRKYSIATEFDPTKKDLLPISREMLFIGTGSKYSSHTSLNSTTPESFTSKDMENNPDFKKIAATILEVNRDLYNYAVDIYGAVIFKDLNNLFKVHEDGLLEYKYLSQSDMTDKGRLDKAFSKAMIFINKRKQLYSGASLFISEIKTDERGYYEFSFDYITKEDFMISIDLITQDREAITLKHAVTVRANEDKVLNVWWIFKNFTHTTETKIYQVNFPDFLDNAFTQYKTLKEDKNFLITDLSVSYKIDNNFRNSELMPMWRVETLNKEISKKAIYTVQMKEKEGS